MRGTSGRGSRCPDLRQPPPAEPQGPEDERGRQRGLNSQCSRGVREAEEPFGSWQRVTEEGEEGGTHA